MDRVHVQVQAQVQRAHGGPSHLQDDELALLPAQAQAGRTRRGLGRVRTASANWSLWSRVGVFPSCAAQAAALFQAQKTRLASGNVLPLCL